MIKLVKKVCIKCGEEKSLNDFPKYKNRKGELKYLNQCKTCNSDYKKRHYNKNREDYLNRSKIQRERDPESHKEYMKQYYSTNREELMIKAKEYSKRNKGVRKTCRDKYRSSAENKFKDKARKAVNLALHRKILVRPNICSSCNEERFTEAHHRDYSKPLEVIWLCKNCHIKQHRLNEGHKSYVIAVDEIAF